MLVFLLMRVDEKDRRIMYELSLNARLPVSRIARQTRIPREQAHYRFRQLTEKGFVQSFITEVNPEALGFFRTTVYLQLYHSVRSVEDQVIAFLESNPYVSWINITIGKW
ncbi:MAG: winged helix-turn-helix transcriptional regulator, partial [Candidatus Diapherotrites archaeon]|nr:winged helix-turn-helix transcriptional regulator [Candidatus Diapherotrites archaeon]